MLRRATKADAQTPPTMTDEGWEANSGSWISDSGHPCLGGERATDFSWQAMRAAIRARERSRLRKTATKAAEFGSPNRSTLTYYIIMQLYKKYFVAKS